MFELRFSDERLITASGIPCLTFTNILDCAFATCNLSFPFQINHINKLFPVFKHRMVIIIREKVIYSM